MLRNVFLRLLVELIFLVGCPCGLGLKKRQERTINNNNYDDDDDDDDDDDSKYLNRVTL